MHDHHGHNHEAKASTNRMAVSATLHCLTGCAIGEIAGLALGTLFGLSTGVTILLAITLAFLFGFGLSARPLVRAGMRFMAALSIVAAADTLSIATMEIVDNGVMLLIPGAMHAGLSDPLFWVSLLVALAAAFVAAVPVNKYLLSRGKGHELLMRHRNHHHHH